MQLKKYILLLDRNMGGALVPFPQKLEYPASKNVPSRAENNNQPDRVFDRTERYKTLDGITARIYVERGASIDVDSYADPIAAEVAQAPIVQQAQQPTTQATPNVDPVSSAVDISAMPVTRIYGRSDDLIEIEGAYSGEVGAGEDGLMLIVSDGTILDMRYGKRDLAIWSITILKKGDAYAGFEPCDDEDADIYSDIVTLRGDIKYVYAASDWAKVQ